MRVLTVNVSESKGTAKYPTEEIELRPDWGVVGDAHAGPGIRQVSLLAKESHERFQPMTKVCLKNGIFGENLTTEGIDLVSLPIGQRLRIGTATCEVSKIGKECHAPCAIGQKVGNCIMPKEGIFVKVMTAGKVRPGDPIEML